MRKDVYYVTHWSGATRDHDRLPDDQPNILPSEECLLSRFRAFHEAGADFHQSARLIFLPWGVLLPKPSPLGQSDP